MYLECDKCGYTIDAKPYHEGQRCPKCKKGVMKEMTKDTIKIAGKLLGFSRNKKGVTTLRIKTEMLRQEDVDIIGKQRFSPHVDLEIEIEKEG